MQTCKAKYINKNIVYLKIREAMWKSKAEKRNREFWEQGLLFYVKSNERLSGKVTFEIRPKGSKGISCGEIQGGN